MAHLQAFYANDFFSDPFGVCMPVAYQQLTSTTQLASSHPPSSSHAALVIIGTGMAGVGLARALRRLGDQRSITLVSADSGDDYSKPLLSTGFAKRLTPEKLAQRSAAELGELRDVVTMRALELAGSVEKGKGEADERLG